MRGEKAVRSAPTAESAEDGIIDSLPWYAVRVRSNFEKTSSTILESRGFEVFYPTYRLRKRRKDRTVSLELPLFAGYFFGRFDHRNRLPILQTPGVVGIVGFGKQPTPVDAEEIRSLALLARSGELAHPHDFLHRGDLVRITAGPLSGLTGILEESKGASRLVLSVTLLQRSVSVEVDLDSVHLLRRGPGSAGVDSASAGRAA